MTAFFLTFLGVVLAMVAGREAVRVARLARAGISLPLLLCVILVCAVAACAAAAWLAGSFANLLSASQRSWFVAAALLLAALEVQFLAAPKEPVEPTRSIGAIAIVLFAGVLADASGLLVLSLSLASGAPVMAAGGGALAVIAALGGAALAGEDWEQLPRHIIRPVVAVLLALSAAAVALFGLSASY